MSLQAEATSKAIYGSLNSEDSKMMSLNHSAKSSNSPYLSNIPLNSLQNLQSCPSGSHHSLPNNHLVFLGPGHPISEYVQPHSSIFPPVC